MTETTEQATPQATALPDEIAAALGVLEASPMYAAVVPMLREKFSGHYALILANNSNVSAILEAKETDPNSSEYQDLTWKRVVQEKGDDEMVRWDARRQKLIAEEQKLLDQLRDKSKTHMRPALSEEQVQAKRKEVNDGKKVIEDSVKGVASVAEMADQMLAMAGAPVENGIWSLMPNPESLMNARGKKSGGKSSGEGYATRLVEAFIDGQTANRNVKRKGVDVFAGHFNYVAEDLSKQFDDKEFPGNQVTALEIEKAYYDSKGVEWRNAEGMPEDHTFDFTKTVQVRNGADNTVKEIPVTKVIRVVRWTKDTKGKEGEIATPENAEGNVDAPSNEGSTPAAE